MKIIRLTFVLLLAACSTISPAQQTALTDVTNTALAAGTGYLTGGQAGAVAASLPQLANDVSDAVVAIRQHETSSSTAPTSATLTAAISTLAVNPAVAKAVGPPVAKAVAAAVIKGVSPNAALEASAVGLEQAVDKAPVP